MRGWRHHALRFVIGGAGTAAVSLIAQHQGPVWAGLLLAFPVLFPAASVRAASAVALGATLGSIALFCFALAACCLLTFGGGESSLLIAATVWLVVAVAAWLVWKRRQRRPPR